MDNKIQCKSCGNFFCAINKVSNVYCGYCYIQWVVHSRDSTKAIPL